MSDYIKVNDGELIPLSNIKRIQTISDQERESLMKLGSHVDANRFNARLDYADGKKSYVPEFVEDIKGQVKLVDLGNETFVPRDNFRKVKDLTDQDRARFQKNTGRELSPDFQAQVETTAGNVLAKSDSLTIMKGLDSGPQMGRNNQPFLQEQQQTVMERALSETGKDKPAPSPSPEPSA